MKNFSLVFAGLLIAFSGFVIYRLLNPEIIKNTEQHNIAVIRTDTLTVYDTLFIGAKGKVESVIDSATGEKRYTAEFDTVFENGAMASLRYSSSDSRFTGKFIFPEMNIIKETAVLENNFSEAGTYLTAGAGSEFLFKGEDFIKAYIYAGIKKRGGLFTSALYLKGEMINSGNKSVFIPSLILQLEKEF